MEIESLRVLKLDSNQLCALPAALFTRLRHLEELSVAWNTLIELSTHISLLQRLKVLRLDFNKLRRLPDELGSCRALRELRVCDNQLESLPTSLACCTSLQELRVSYNAIAELPPTLCCMQSLRVLEAHGNPLRSPPPAVALAGMDAIRHYLTGSGSSSAGERGHIVRGTGQAPAGSSRAPAAAPQPTDSPGIALARDLVGAGHGSDVVQRRGSMDVLRNLVLPPPAHLSLPQPVESAQAPAPAASRRLPPAARPESRGTMPARVLPGSVTAHESVGGYARSAACSVHRSSRPRPRTQHARHALSHRLPHLGLGVVGGAPRATAVLRSSAGAAQPPATRDGRHILTFATWVQQRQRSSTVPSHADLQLVRGVLEQRHPAGRAAALVRVLSERARGQEADSSLHSEPEGEDAELNGDLFRSPLVEARVGARTRVHITPIHAAALQRLQDGLPGLAGGGAGDRDGRNVSVGGEGPRPTQPAASTTPCAICYDAAKDALLAPCGHVVACMGCAAELKGRGQRCPVCRARIQHVYRVFVA